MVLKGSRLRFTYYGLFYPLPGEEKYEFMHTYTMTVTEHRRVQCIYAQACIYAVIYQQSILTLQIISVLSCLVSFTSTPLHRYTGSVLKDNHECTLLLSLFPYYHFMPSHIKLIQKLPKDKKEGKKKRKRKKRISHTQPLPYQTSAHVFCREVQPQPPCVLLAPPQWQSASNPHVRNEHFQKSGHDLLPI
jgi:hypothetical protein